MASVTGIDPRSSTLAKIEAILGEETGLLEHQCKTIPRESLQLPGPDFVERIHSASDRPVRVLTSLQALFNTGRLAGTGYVSIPPGGSGYRALRRRFLRAKPGVLRP